MRHLRVAQRAEHAGFAAHRLRAVDDRMGGRAPEHELARAAPEPQQDVLRAAGEGRRVLDLAGFEPLAAHPVRQAREIDQRPPIAVAHGFQTVRMPCDPNRPPGRTSRTASTSPSVIAWW